MSQRLQVGVAPRFYEEIALAPEYGVYRRFGDLWAKKLYDDIEEVCDQAKRVNDALARQHRKPGHGATILDLSRSIVKKEYPEIMPIWMRYERALIRYSQALHLNQQIVKLPEHAHYAGRRLKELGLFVDIGGNEVFGPTGEAAGIYQQPPNFSDKCALNEPPAGDRLTTALADHARWLDKQILDRFRRCIRGKSPPRRGEPRYILHGTISAIMDYATCIVPSLLFMAVMFALVRIGPLDHRIATIGGSGLVFALVVKLLVGHPTRGEIFSATGAFFAVAAVFVSNPGNSVVNQENFAALNRSLGSWGGYN